MMVSYSVSNVKRCMSELLTKSTFDFFLLREAIIKTYATFSIDGHRHDDFYSIDELESMDLEEEVMTFDCFREKCFDLIKGNKLPLAFSFIFETPKRVVNQIIEANEISYDASKVSLVCNFRYVDGELTIITAVDMKEFLLDKSLEKAFDKWIYDFLNSNGIELEKLT